MEEFTSTQLRRGKEQREKQKLQKRESRMRESAQLNKVKELLRLTSATKIETLEGGE